MSTYNNGPEGMPRVKRMSDSTIDWVINGVDTIGYLDEEGHTKLRNVCHAVAEEVLARLPAWPTVPAGVTVPDLEVCHSPICDARCRFPSCMGPAVDVTAPVVGQDDARAAALANRVRDLIADHLADNWPMIRYHLEEVEKKVRAINADYLLAQSKAAMSAAPAPEPVTAKCCGVPDGCTETCDKRRLREADAAAIQHALAQAGRVSIWTSAEYVDGTRMAVTEQWMHGWDALRNLLIGTAPTNAEPVTSEGAVVVTRAGSRIVAVTRQDEEGRIRSTLAEASAPMTSEGGSALAQQLREYANNPGYSHQDYADTMRAAADELERAAVPAQEGSIDTPDDQAGVRIVKFIEGFDKKLEASGFTHEQRHKIVGALVDSKDIARAAIDTPSAQAGSELPPARLAAEVDPAESVWTVKEVLAALAKKGEQQ